MLRTRIDLDAISHNVKVLKDMVGPQVNLMCVVKADAYGHGALKVAPIMAKAGADALGVATLEEAVALRRSGIDLPILGWMWDPNQDLTDALASNIDIGIPSLEHAQALVAAESPVRVYVKVETGMHRSGVDEEQWRETFHLLADAPHITVLGLMSHFACADEPEHPLNDAQERTFRRAIDIARECGLDCPINHLANSPGALARPSSHFEQVRVGIACYGLDPVNSGADLRPAMTWASTVSNVKSIQAGEAASYGLTWEAEHDGQLAVIAAGYADGVPRSAQDKLQVGIGGKLYPQVGRVCMDQILVDLGENPYNVVAGDEAILFGEGGMSATELADALGTIDYEVLCLPGGRSRRVYEGGVDLAG